MVNHLSNQLMVNEFHESFGIDREERQQLSLALIYEEFIEVSDELYTKVDLSSLPPTLPKPKSYKEIDREALAKELADLLYVTYGTADVFGIDLDEAYRAVHESNMTKLDDNGKPVLREDGKVLKSENYKEPDLASAVQR